MFKLIAAYAAPMLCVVSLAACGPGAQQEASVPFEAPSVLVETRDMDVERITIPDLETEIYIEAMPAEGQECAPRAEELRTPKGVLSICIADAGPPVPDRLDVVLRMKAIKHLPFDATPVLFRGRLLRDDAPIETFSTLVQDFSGISKEFMPKLRVDALAGLDTPPETMLIYAEIEAIIMPRGTLNATDAPPEDAPRTLLRSNPLRINLHREGGA